MKKKFLVAAAKLAGAGLPQDRFIDGKAIRSNFDYKIEKHKVKTITFKKA
jgi:hypothetical protein